MESLSSRQSLKHQLTLQVPEDDSDDEAGGDWLEMLGPGTWSEVLRRYVHSRWEESNGLASDAVKSAAGEHTFHLQAGNAFIEGQRKSS